MDQLSSGKASPMRVLVDTNIFISYLLNPRNKGAIGLFFEAVVEGKVTLLIPQELLDEIVLTTLKPRLAKYISGEQAEKLIAILNILGEEVPRITSPIPSLSRDRKDDYLLAYATVGEADYLITGDKDLLVLERVGKIPVVTVRDFVDTEL